ncbi:MAG TPA: hypothetical protein DIS88_09680 [Prevotella sp.]|nr:hypothetical protein [Prevotella sp.]
MEQKDIRPLEMAQTILNVTYDDLSEKNIKLAKDKLLDNIGNLAGGALAFGNREVKHVVESYGETEEAPIFMLGGKASLGDAGMVNALSARSNDYEPMFMNLDGKYAPSKESATLINAVLTAAAVYGFSGKEYIIDEVIGEDLSIRIMAAGGRWNFAVGYDSSFTMPIYGVCAQFARMRGLTAQQLNDAWGMAMGMVGGTMSHIYDYATSAKLGAGYNIRNADFCTRLAMYGFSSLNNIFEGPRNIYRQYRGMEEACNPEYLNGQQFGKKFYMEEMIKTYPVGTPALSVARLGESFIGTFSDSKEIKEIELETCDGYTEMYYWPPFEVGRDPLMHAQFSFQYALCAPLKYGKFGVRHYSEGALRNPEILRLCNITRMHHSSDLNKDISEMRATITLQDGTKIVRTMDTTKFNKFELPSQEQILDKYWDQINAYGLLSHAKATKIIELVDHLEELKDMRELTDLLIQ